MSASETESQTSNAPSLGDLAGTAAFIVALISAWLYATGWTYAYHYFDRFGIPLLMVDIPKEHYFVYGGVVAGMFPIWAGVIGGAVIGLVLAWRWFAGKLGRPILALGLAAILAIFWLGHEGAVDAAHTQYSIQRTTDYSAYPRVKVWTKQDTKLSKDSPLSSDNLTRGCYRLLLHSRDRLFLLRPLRGAAAAELPILVVPWDRMETIRIMPDYTSCE